MASPVQVQQSFAGSQARSGGYDELHHAALRAEGRTHSRQCQRSKLAARSMQRAAAGGGGVDRERAQAILQQQHKSSGDENLFGHLTSSFHEARGKNNNSMYRSRLPLPWQVYVTLVIPLPALSSSIALYLV